MEKDLKKHNKMVKIDFIILGIIIFFYSILSFINLGSFKNPQTFYEFSKNEEVILKLKEDSDIIRINFFNGELNGNYQIYVSDDNEEYYINEFTGNGAFSWNEEKILKKAKYIKIKALDKSILGSITLYDNSKNKIKIDEVVGMNKNKNNLIDEQDMTPKTIGYMNSTYFDEIYFARTAYEYANNLTAYEWVHPPLGKLIQAIPIKLFHTMAPFYYRLMGNLAGILMIVVMYLLCKKLFRSTKLAALGALLMTFDTFHFVQTRIGTVDSFLVLFILLSYYFMYKYIDENKIKNLLVSGLFFGCAAAVKWTGLFAGLGLAIIFFIHIIKNKYINIKLLSRCIIFYILIPLTIYLGSYLMFPNVTNRHINSIEDIRIQTKDMYNYHSTLDATHPFSSNWYTWTISYKPVWYYQGEVDIDSHGTIVAIGNIVIWWAGIIAFTYTLIRLIRKKDQKSLFIVIGGLCLYLPYIFIGRCMFLYHYFPVLPFIMLSIVNMFNDICSKTKGNKGNIVFYTYIVLFILVFSLYYPAISGVKTSDIYLDRLKLLSSWIF